MALASTQFAVGFRTPPAKIGGFAFVPQDRAVDDLHGRLARVHVSTLVRLEGAGWKVAPGNATTIDRVTTVLENKGVEFIENGVRLTKRPRR